jgi:rhodanese-related sulfurtransferase
VAARDLGTLEIENAGRQRYCGVHAVVMVARMLGKHIEVSELLDNQNVSSNGGSTLADLCRMIDGQGFERQVLADARTSGQFENNHIPLAISLPIDTSALECLVFGRDRQSDGKLVVTYCNSVRCRWADQVAKRLARMGVQVQVYSGGIESWNQTTTTSNK